MPYTKKFTFRLDPETISKLQFLAEKDMSSMSRIIRLLILAACKQVVDTSIDEPKEG